MDRAIAIAAISGVYNFLLVSAEGQSYGAFDVTEQFINTQINGNLATVLTYSSGTSSFGPQTNAERFTLKREEEEWKIAIYLFDRGYPGS